MEGVYNFLGYDMPRQLMLVLYALMLGASLGAVFDVLRISRSLLSYRGAGETFKQISEAVISIVTFFEDIIFAFICSFAFIVFCFKANNGKSRFFILLGAVLGFIIYILTVGRLTRLATDLISRTLYKILSFLYNRCLLPLLRFSGRILKKMFDFTLGRLANTVFAKIVMLNTKKVSRELHRKISRLYIENNRKDNGDETNSHTNARKARDFHSIHNNDSHPRRNTDRIQPVKRGAGKTA